MSNKDRQAFLVQAAWLVGKTLNQVQSAIIQDDNVSRIKTKGSVGYVVESYFGVTKNSAKQADIPALAIELKTSPLKYSKSKGKLISKEPLSLNIIDYFEEAENRYITESSLYKKNKDILFVFYIHDETKSRSEYIIKYVFIWIMDNTVLQELNSDYIKIVEKIKQGKAHEIHQNEHLYLTLCPKHGGRFKDPDCNKSKRGQPYSVEPAEIRAFRLKSNYMNIILDRYIKNKKPEI